MDHIHWPAAVTACARVTLWYLRVLVLGVLCCCAPQAGRGAAPEEHADDGALDFARHYCQEELRYGADDLVVHSPKRQAEIERHPGSWQFVPSTDPFAVATSCVVKGLRREKDRVLAEVIYRRVARCPGEARVDAEGPDMEAVSLVLVRRGDAWRVLDPPPPHIGLDVAIRYFAQQASQDRPSWFTQATQYQLDGRQRLVSAMETLMQIRCQELPRRMPGVEGLAREAVQKLIDGYLLGDAGRDALGLGCLEGKPDPGGWPPGRSALVATGYRIKGIDTQGSTAKALVEYDVVARVNAEDATAVTELDEVVVDMVLRDGQWHPGKQVPLFVSLNTAIEAHAVALARLRPEWFKNASQERLAFWKRKSQAIKRLFVIEVDLAKSKPTGH